MSSLPSQKKAFRIRIESTRLKGYENELFSDVFGHTVSIASLRIGLFAEKVKLLYVGPATLFVVDRQADILPVVRLGILYVEHPARLSDLHTIH